MEDITELAKALIGFQADMENVAKEATNPFFKSKYATLEAIITAAKPHLKKHKLAVVQLPSGRGLETIIVHESGQSIRATADLVIKDETPQGQGSAITYMRRYALSAALCIATEDDDGNEASRPSQSSHKAAVAPKPTKPTKDPSTELKAAKDRTITLLKLLEYDNLKTKAQYEATVLAVTGLELTDANLDPINEKLAALVEKQDANK
jgi:hypothetical protein